MTLDQAVEFVLMALREQTGGEIFVPKAPSIKIADLGRALYPKIPLQVVGIRPGEKIHEILISSDDARNTYAFDSHYRIMPAFAVQRTDKLIHSLKGATKVEDGFSLASNTNHQLLTSEKEIISLVSQTS